METKNLRVAFVKSNSTTLLKAIAEDGMSVSVPVAYRSARKPNEIVTLELQRSKNNKFWVAVGLSESKSKSNTKSNENLFAKALKANEKAE